MKKYLCLMFVLLSSICYAAPAIILDNKSVDSDSSLLTQLVDSKLANMDDKLARAEQSNKDSISDLKTNTDEKLSDKFKQLDERADNIDRWLSFLGIIIAITTFVVAVIQIVSAIGLVALRKEADKLLEEIQGLHNRAEGKVAYIEELTNKISDDVNLTREDGQQLSKASETLMNIPESQLTADELFIKGLNAQRNNEYYEAIAYYGQAIKLSTSKKRLSYAYNNRGMCKAKLKQYAEAIEDYDEAIRLNLDYYRAHYNRGIAKFNLEQFADALKDYDKAIELNSGYINAFYNKSCLYMRLKNQENAFDYLKKALDLGYDVNKIRNDEVWKDYLNDEDFKRLIAKYTK